MLRFFASEQALGHANAKRCIVNSGGDKTLHTRVFDIVRGHAWPAHITGRLPINRFSAEWRGRESALTADLARQQADYRQAAGATGIPIWPRCLPAKRSI